MTPEQEPMYLISESEMKEYSRLLADDHSGSFALVSKVEALAKKYEDEFRARGPVHSGAQQQAPVIFEGQSRFACPFQNGCEDGDGFCEYPCEKWLDWHDAAIAAQARKEGYAEGAAAEKREGSIKASKAYQAGIEVGTIEGAAAERERVLHDLGAKCDWAITVKKQSPRTGQAQLAYGQVLKWIQEIRNESLRSQPEKQQEGERK